MNPPIEERFRPEQLRLSVRIARHLSTAEDVRDALRTVLEWLGEVCGLERSVITLMSESGEEVRADVTVDAIPETRTKRMKYRAGEGITGRVFSTGEAVYLPTLEAGDFLDRSGLRRALNPAAISFFCVPIRYRGRPIGTLSADKRRESIDDPALELAFLQHVADMLAPFVERRRLETELEIFRHASEPGGAFDRIIGNSPAIREVKHLIVRVADAPTTVLVSGETGVGKGVVARLIHELSGRKDAPFIEVNCAAIPESLIESELFGHEKGAFTGAYQRRIGVLERAASGTVFLDEIGDLPLPAQTKLLRVLQSREFERVGGAATLHTDARIIAATNRDLVQAVADGAFRSDLYYRLNVFPIHVPPLRVRGTADIMLLVNHFVARISERLHKRVTSVSPDAAGLLAAYPWPGNVRELENVIERAILLADGDTILPAHLPPSLLAADSRAPEAATAYGDDLPSTIRRVETEMIVRALRETGGNQSAAARHLGISKRMIQYKIRKYGIDSRLFRTAGETGRT